MVKEFTHKQLVALALIKASSPDATPEMSLQELGIDSLEFLLLLQDLEKRFGIILTDEKVQTLQTVDDLIHAASD